MALSLHQKLLRFSWNKTESNTSKVLLITKPLMDWLRDLKQSLKASANGRTLIQRLSSYLSYHTTAHSTAGVTPCKLVMQRDLHTRFGLLLPNTKQSVMKKYSAQNSSHDRRSRSREFIFGDRVLVWNHRPGPDWIPGTIIGVLGPVTFIVEIEDGGQR